MPRNVSGIKEMPENLVCPLSPTEGDRNKGVAAVSEARCLLADRMTTVLSASPICSLQGNLCERTKIFDPGESMLFVDDDRSEPAISEVQILW